MYGLDYSDIAEIFKVLGHPVRLRIIDELSESDKTVSQLQHLIGVSQALLSQHLTVLRHSKIIKSIRKGNTVYYSITNPVVVAILKLISQNKT
jgi:ArsR family transcriptional regulator